MSRKKIMAAVSIILVTGVVFSIIATVLSSHNVKQKQKNKALSNFCSSTHYRESCERTLGSVNSTNPKDFIVMAMLASEDAIKKFFNYSDSMIVQAKDNSRTKMALGDCKDMMNYAIDSLQASYSIVNDTDLHIISDHINDLRTWLSAVISYQQSCLDGFEHDKELKETMQKGIVDASELASNALTIVTKLPDILSSLCSPTSDITNLRRLLSVEKNCFPSWILGKDRHLLDRLNNKKLKPTVVVAKDGSGQFKTIGEALAAAPKKSNVRHVIYIKTGIYDEYVTVGKQYTNILMYGDGPIKTIVTGRKSVKTAGGITAWQSATFSAIGNGFIAKSMGFRNTAGPKKREAVALRVQSDKSAFFYCRIDAYQNTLYNQANRQFFRNCVISGTIDFIFGDSPVVIQNSLIIVRRAKSNQFNTVTAQGKSFIDENTGTVIQNCKIVPEQKLLTGRFKIPTYLGRPWKKFSTTIIMESALGDFIKPEGWMQFDGPDKVNSLDTPYYAEYNNSGPGANLNTRVNWKGYNKIDRETAMKFAIQSFLSSNDNWLPLTGIPFTSALR